MILTELFTRWQRLPVFADKASRFARTRLAVKTRRGILSTGVAMHDFHGRFWITVRRGYSTVDAHVTLLHEMAHVRASWTVGKCHTAEWKRVFLQAVLELTGRSVKVDSSDPFVIDAAVRQCLRAPRACA